MYDVQEQSVLNFLKVMVGIAPVENKTFIKQEGPGK